MTGCEEGFSTSPDYVTEGTVVFGSAYLANTNVCIDENGNFMCDEGEYNATTDGNGHFTFDAASYHNHVSDIVIAEVKSGVSLKTDDNTTFDHDFVMAGMKNEDGNVGTLYYERYLISYISTWEIFRDNPAYLDPRTIADADYNLPGVAEETRAWNAYVSEVYYEIDRQIDAKMLADGFVPSELNTFSRFMYKTDAMKQYYYATDFTLEGPFYRLKELFNQSPLPAADMVNEGYSLIDFTDMAAAVQIIQECYDNDLPYYFTGF